MISLGSVVVDHYDNIARFKVMISPSHVVVDDEDEILLLLLLFFLTKGLSNFCCY